MGEAKRRGTYEQRKQQAIAAGRKKVPRPSAAPSFQPALLPPWLRRLFASAR